MQVNNVKNIVVLKSLPSNIVEEAIIILKSNKYAKKFQTIETNNKKEIEKNDFSKKEYVVKEAEAILASYVTKVENSRKFERTNQNLKRKYELLKKYSLIITILFCISIIILFV